jgi:hypothetical protein
VVRCQDSAPNGVPRAMLLRKAESSASLCGWLTQSIQSSPRGPGPRCNGTPPDWPAKALSEHHRHCSARRTNRARNAFRSTIPQHHKEVLVLLDRECLLACRHSTPRTRPPQEKTRMSPFSPGELILTPVEDDTPT